MATAQVQCGISLSQLNRFLARQQRRFGPDPANSAVTTMGSVAALDASGSRWLKYGAARQNIRGMQVVLADGQVVRFHRDGAGQDARVRNLKDRIGSLAERHAETIVSCSPKTLINRCGYYLAPGEASPQLTDVMIGSEGTLGIITELTVDTVPIPAHRGVALLLFERLELAARAALELRRFQPWACDLLDRRLMRLATESEMRFQVLLPEATEASLLIEVQDDSAAEVRGRLEQMIQVIQRKKKLAFDSKKALEPAEVDFYWSLGRFGGTQFVSFERSTTRLAVYRRSGGATGQVARVSCHDAECAEATRSHRVAFFARRPWSVAHSSVSGSSQSGPRTSIASARQRYVPGSDCHWRNDKW